MGALSGRVPVVGVFLKSLLFMRPWRGCDDCTLWRQWLEPRH